MFRGFVKSRPAVSIFHHPSSAQSSRALELLRSSLINPYPPSNPKAGPLEFDLEVVESAPTPDQVQTILAYLPVSTSASSPSSIASTFISSHPSSVGVASDGQVTSKTLTELARSNPGALKWPIVVDWMGGRASVGDVDGVRRMLDEIRKEQSP
ncbi:uncharacterized protein FOMMEDRAFT_166719 [Fomitiporia mediterranea MF3/22]|uniref:uncharacterized protein n=1 Tax=Fomitiporia mediterranea (strain MF3/22) TaxID=694068 RepID=UPI0004408B9B|nr:uncharacterized protein FOMMEDRAFT_166719 [Fomitiporia mediterranea MF3/22]EJD05016.1 hypothetical protein FOMMEDRAFT_166719 [Fomitiporia mediterranea MF3/22]